MLKERSQAMRRSAVVAVATAVSLLGIALPTSAATGCDPATITGTSDSDENLEGTAGDDVIDALGGEDRVTGFGGDDRICLGRGGRIDKSILGFPIPVYDHASGGEGDDRLQGGRGLDNLRPGPGHDSANGGAGPDYLGGSAGSDRMLGGSGSDSIFGGRGNDVVRGGPGKDRVNGGKGTDACFGTRTDRFIDCETVNGEPV